MALFLRSKEENVTTTQANENESGSFTKISNIIRTTSFFDNTMYNCPSDFFFNQFLISI